MPVPDSKIPCRFRQRRSHDLRRVALDVAKAVHADHICEVPELVAFQEHSRIGVQQGVRCRTGCLRVVCHHVLQAQHVCRRRLIRRCRPGARGGSGNGARALSATSPEAVSAASPEDDDLHGAGGGIGKRTRAVSAASPPGDGRLQGLFLLAGVTVPMVGSIAGVASTILDNFGAIA